MIFVKYEKVLTKKKLKRKIILTRKDIEEQKEQAQEDIKCILDGIDVEYLDNVCQVIVNRFNILINKI